jgi:hypothetical protein
MKYNPQQGVGDTRSENPFSLSAAASSEAIWKSPPSISVIWYNPATPWVSFAIRRTSSVAKAGTLNPFHFISSLIRPV